MNLTMKSAVHDGEKSVCLRQTEVPHPGRNEVLVNIKSCAICGSDTWWNQPPSPDEPVHGHEAAGVVTQCGEGATRFRPGDRVVCYAIHGCGTCAYCRRGEVTYCETKRFVEGGFQEYMVYPQALLFPCPEEFDFVTASLLSDAIGVPLRGLRRLKPRPEDKTVIWGMGPLGLLQLMFLKASGVTDVIAVDTVTERLEKAKMLGASLTLNPTACDVVSEIRRYCGGIGADAACLYVRHPKATADAFASTRGGATICTFVGLDGAYALPEWHERTLVWSFYFTPDEYAENIAFVQKHRIDVRQVVSDVVPLERIDEAFRKRFDDPAHSLKIVIAMP